MRMPSYIRVTGLKRNAETNQLEATILFRPEHPSILPLIWGMLSGCPGILKPFAVLWGWWRVCRSVRA